MKKKMTLRDGAESIEYKIYVEISNNHLTKNIIGAIVIVYRVFYAFYLFILINIFLCDITTDSVFRDLAFFVLWDLAIYKNS